VREDVGLSVMLLVSAIPAAVISSARSCTGWSRVPAHAAPHRPRQPVLREQITGMRVVRAFVREPQETERFGRRPTTTSPTPRCAPAG
jgi:ATP-binding cassette, subfamily B, multidrug efflux pump